MLIALGGTQARACVPPIAYLYFPPGDAEVTEVHRAILETLVLAPSREMHTGQSSFTIAGHADSPGDEAYNLALSERRAEAIRRYLLSVGVPPSQINLTFYGETRPYSGGTGSDPVNRVVTVELFNPDYAQRCP